jgi:hypothetical protein
VAIGTFAGQYFQVINTVAIGNGAGQSNQGESAVAIGNSAGQTGQLGFAVAIGNGAGQCNQQSNAVAIGNNAGQTGQKDYAVAIGYQAGLLNQGVSAVAIGCNAAKTGQKDYAMAIGFEAGLLNQGGNAVAIGYQSGKSNQGANSIAIGAKANNVNNSNAYVNYIVLNATGSNLSPPASSTFTVKTIRSNVSNTQALCYDSTSGEITFNNSGTPVTKTFVIDHPLDKEKYLVHACLEGPEAGVYYRGTATIPAEANFIELSLPSYADALASDFTVHVTPVLENEEDLLIPSLAITRVKHGKFKVYKTSRITFPSSFDYLVFGKRCAIEVEPERSKVVVKGSGPYIWL